MKRCYRKPRHSSCAAYGSNTTNSWPTMTSPYLRPPERSQTCRTAPVVFNCVSTRRILRGIVRPGRSA